MDSEADFERKTRLMFERVKDHFREVSIRFVVRIAERLVEDTPGFGNQFPEDTRYIPTGRLRGGYSFGPTKLNTAGRWEGGPYSDYGAETVDRIEASLRASGPRSGFINNDVAYGYIVREGLGNHVVPRDFLRCANPTTQKNALAEALASMRGS